MPTSQALLLCCTCNRRSGIVLITQVKAGGAAVVVSVRVAGRSVESLRWFLRAIIHIYVKVLSWSQRVAFDRLHSATQAAKRKTRSVESVQRSNHQEESHSCSCSRALISKPKPVAHGSLVLLLAITVFIAGEPRPLNKVHSNKRHTSKRAANATPTARGLSHQQTPCYTTRP